jgi:DNA-directed RNA polymerase subunit alpha
METTVDLGAIFNQDVFTDESFRTLKVSGFAGKEAINRFRQLVARLKADVAAPAGDVTGPALKLGMCHLLLSDPEQAARWLLKAKAGGQRSYYLGLAYRERKLYAESAAEFEKAAQQGWDPQHCHYQQAESLFLLGRHDKVEEMLGEVPPDGPAAADWHYLRGRLEQEKGDVDSAVDHYEKALEQDGEHAQAMFHLGYLLDLHGSDERALDLYETCVELPFVHLHALMNLAVIYEDRCEYERAADCLERILEVDPNNARAQLYLKDVLAARDMYIDEQEIKELETRNAVLDIPVTDFELSVRSRNCLKKMSILTLGDLLRTTEEKLLAYKNFGETSLREIRAMLAQKGLSLGQYAHEKTVPQPPAVPANVPQGDPEVLGRPAATLQLSVRSRKCLQALGVTTIGELVGKTESELLGSRNFGQTSLGEIKGRLAELGLSLRPAMMK